MPPLFRFPQGQTGAGMVPPTPGHAASPAKKRCLASCTGSPHKRGPKALRWEPPLCIPPTVLHTEPRPVTSEYLLHCRCRQFAHIVGTSLMPRAG
jgi:hypothetical protein